MIAFALGAGLVPLVGAQPVAAETWSVTLSASSADLEVGQAVTLTADVNMSVTGTGNYIDIFNQTTGAGVGYCTTGSSCSISWSEASAGSYSFVAYVDSAPTFQYPPPCCVNAVSNAVTVRWHARATAAFDVQFAVEGTLPRFPCVGSCAATFTGSGTGHGHARASDLSSEYNAVFSVPNGFASGHAAYNEPNLPFCPGIGSASGTVNLGGPSTGVVYRTGTPTSVGTVTGVEFVLEYVYDRAGPGAAVVILGGTAKIHFTFPDTGSDYFVSNVSGAGPGLFEVNPVEAVERCQAPGPLKFAVVGDVLLHLA